MSYTNVEQVRHCLATRYPVVYPVHDQQIIMSMNEYVSFYGGAVDDSSIVVKSRQTNEPARQAVTLSDGLNSLCSSPIVRGSVVVASDSSLGRIFVENVDYVIDYPSGDLKIKNGGTLTTGQTVTVWHVAFHVYLNGTDYQVHREQGEIRAVSGSNIADGETVWLDYTPLSDSFNDEILTSAVTTANGLLEREIDPDRQFGADPTLGAAATCRALEIICHTAAMRELSSTSNGANNALAWVKLAEIHAAQAERHLRSFRPPYSGPAAPELV